MSTFGGTLGSSVGTWWMKRPAMDRCRRPGSSSA
ncbi:hypothetical protein JOD27_008796 [Lentzea nigeriaca]|nr:hypothetical protein [Lentzea nigeriaca]